MVRFRRFSYAVGETVLVFPKDPDVPEARLSRQHWHLLACVAIVLALLAGIGMRQPSPPDEPRFVLAARAMVDSGQWLLPHRGGDLYAEKPPVFMWMQAASHQLLGNWNLAFLLPSLLAALLTLWLCWDLGRRLWNRRVAWWAMLALASCLQFGLMAKRAQIDMVLVGLTTLAMWGLLRHLLEQTLSWHGVVVSIVHGDVQHAAHGHTGSKGIQTIVQNGTGVVAQQRVVVVLRHRGLRGERLGGRRVAVEGQQGIGSLDGAEDGRITRRGGTRHILGQQRSSRLSAVQRLGRQLLQERRHNEITKDKQIMFHE